MAFRGHGDRKPEDGAVEDEVISEGGTDFEEDADEENEGEYEEAEQPQAPASEESRRQIEKTKVNNFLRRMSTERVSLRVHDVLIKGNIRTKESLIEVEVEAIKQATTMQELLQAAGAANARLQQLEIFDSVNIMLDAGPPELPGTTNVIIEVVETKNPLSGDIGVFTKPEARSWSLEGSLKLKNLFGYGDLWDGSLGYEWDQASEVSAGVLLPRFKSLRSPVQARVSLLSQDWLKFSSYKERALGLSLSVISTRHHDLVYNLAWRILSDPSQLSSRSIRSQLGHSLISSLKYTYKIDKRNSPLRPTQGYAFVSTSQVGGLLPDSRSLQFIRQEIDLRYAFPLGLYRAALNVGVSGGVTFPWGPGFLSKPSSLPNRFFLGGNSSPVCTLGGPLSLSGFKVRGLGPMEPRRRQLRDEPRNETSAMDFLGGDLAITAFVDLSFDLPLRLFREAGIHGHAFACAGNLTKLTENEFRNLNIQKMLQSFRSSVGVGIIFPTKLFRMEVNYCYILKQLQGDRGKNGVQFSFSAPF